MKDFLEYSGLNFIGSIVGALAVLGGTLGILLGIAWLLVEYAPAWVWTIIFLLIVAGMVISFVSGGGSADGGVGSQDLSGGADGSQ